MNISKLLLIVSLITQLSLAPAMQQNSKLCAEGIHLSNELVEYIEIIPHIKCDHIDRCQYCCEAAIKRKVQQCLHCNYCRCSDSYLGNPRDFFKMQTRHETALSYASRINDLRTVSHLLRYGVNPNTRDFFWTEGQTPLMIASVLGHENIVIALLKAKANPNLLSLRGESALTLASGAPFARVMPNDDYINIVKRLLAAKANPDLHAFDYNTPLINALNLKEKGHAMVHALLEAKASPFHKSPDVPWNHADEAMKTLMIEYLTTKKEMQPKL